MTVEPVRHVFYIDVPVRSGPLGDVLPNWGPNPQSPSNILHITADDVVMWNGEAINRGQLISNLQNGLMSEFEPELYFTAAPDASFDTCAQILMIVRYSGITKFTFIGLEEHRTFDREPV